MRFLKAFGTFYIVVAGLVGIFYYLSYRIDCIKSDGFFNAFTGDCKISGFNMVTRLPPGLIESQLKGLMWGYDLIIAVTNAQQISESQRRQALMDLRKSVENGDRELIRKIDQAAQRFVQREQIAVGRQLDEFTVMTGVNLKGKVIFWDYSVSGRPAFSVIKDNQEIFRATQKKRMCRNPSSNERQVLDMFFAANYKLQMKYRLAGSAEEVVVLINSCD